jgi:hypothetical protein
LSSEQRDFVNDDATVSRCLPQLADERLFGFQRNPTDFGFLARSAGATRIRSFSFRGEERFAGPERMRDAIQEDGRRGDPSERIRPAPDVRRAVAGDRPMR